MNATHLLQLIREQGAISRSSLAQITRLSKPTVSELVSLLIQKDLVIEIGSGKPSSRGGKKPTLLRFNADCGRTAAVDIGSDTIKCALSDLNGEVLRRSSAGTHPERGAGSVIATVKGALTSLLGREPGTAAKLRVIGIAAPGIVDVQRGVVQETDNVFGWRDVDLRAELSEFRVPVVVDNDVNMAALSELKFGLGRNVANFVLIRLSTGIGAGIVLGGHLYQGSHWAAGEIGHMILNANAKVADCGPRGYLESVVGSDRVSERVRELAKDGNSSLGPRLGTMREWDAVCLLAREGDTGASQLLDALVRHLGTAVVNVAAAYDPDLVILLGEMFVTLLDDIRQFASSLVPWPLEIRLSDQGEEASLQGALAAAVAASQEQIANSLQATTA